jgi:hypothetical protein
LNNIILIALKAKISSWKAITERETVGHGCNF